MNVETGNVEFHENKTRMYGLDPSDFDHYEDFTERVHPDDYDQMMEAMRAHLEGRVDKYDTEYRIQTASGEYIWHRDVGGITRRTDDGQPLEVTGIVIDVTERKRTEQKLQEVNEELAFLNKLVRHDIRNDMAVAVGWLDVLEARGSLTEEQKEYVQKIRRATQHTVDLTANLKDLVAVLEEDTEHRLETVNLTAVIRDELDKVEEMFENVVVRTVSEETDVRVKADKMLSTVISNILTNAVHHNDQDVTEIDVEIEVDAETVTVQIADNGPGISEATRDELFDPGAKGPESMGTGMGLYLVRKLVNSYDGTIRVETNDPRGARFSIELLRA